MKRAVVLAVVSLALLGARQPTPPPAQQDNMAPVKAPMPPSEHPPELPSVDDTFAIAAVQGGNAEMSAARLALQRSSTDGVLAFARLMIADHSTIAEAGGPLLRRHLAHMPPKLGPPDALAMQFLATASAVDFDQNYAVLQIGDHLATETAFATEARDGSDPALRTFAKKWLPTIQAHLQLAVTLVKHVGGDTPFKR